MKFLKVLFIIFLVFATGCKGKQENIKKEAINNEKPNVLIVFPDQYRRYSAGFWSTPEYKGKTVGKPDPVVTPTVDRLAKNGVVFTNAISNFPLCSPHRGMLLSGMYPEQNGIWNNCRRDREHALKSNIKAITDVFYEAGYNTSYFGKCHWINTVPVFDEFGNYQGTTEPPGGKYINAYDTYVPPGKDRHSIEYFYQSVVDTHINPSAYSSDPALVGGKKDGEPFKPGEFSLKTESRNIINYIKNDRGQRDENKPFFMIWAPNPPHAPWDKKNTDMVEYHKHYSEEKIPELNNLVIRDNADLEKAGHARTYFSNVTSVDKYIGLVIDELEQSGKLDNTIVVFSSDHGEMLGSHHVSGKNKIETESLAIPLIIHWPKQLQHKIEESFFSVPDLMPTLLGLAGLKNKIPKEVEGYNLAKNLKNVAETASGPKSALILLPKSRGVINAQYTLGVEATEAGNEHKVFLYDNINDPYQLTRLNVSEKPEVSKKMLIELGQFLKETNDPWFQEKRFSGSIKYP